jgi:hypothetical protein
MLRETGLVIGFVLESNQSGSRQHELLITGLLITDYSAIHPPTLILA